MAILLVGLGGKTEIDFSILAQHFSEKKDLLPQKIRGSEWLYEIVDP
jgi:hypothetical protein